MHAMLWIELNCSCNMEHVHWDDKFRVRRRRVVLRTQWRTKGVENTKREEHLHWTLRFGEAFELRTLGRILCMDLFCVWWSCNLFSLLIYMYFKTSTRGVIQWTLDSPRHPIYIDNLREIWVMFSEQAIFRSVVEGSSGGSASFLKLWELLEAQSLYRAYFRLDKLLTIHFLKEERGQIPSHH